MNYFLNFLLTLILGCLIYLILVFKKNEQNSFKEQDLVDKISIHLNKFIQEEREVLGKKIFEGQQETSLKLNNLENHIQTKFDLQNSNQELQFEKIGNQNQVTLSNILSQTQKSILEQLSQSIHELINLNSKNFQLLLQTNQERLNQINSDLQKRLDENFNQNLKSFQEVTKNLGQIQTTAQQMIKSTESIDKLNNIFARTSSKAFGDFSEKYLEALLKEHLAPQSWKSQVKITGSDDKIDFVIYLDDKKVGIDSKFPVTRYQDFLAANPEQKALKLKEYLQEISKMAKDISNKYYKENFLDVLFLYLPSDGMYTEVVNNPQVVDFLQKLKVTACSPTTIFPLIIMIQTHQYKLNINQNAENIINGLKAVGKNVQSFREEFRKLGDKMRQAQNNYNQASHSLDGVENNILRLSSNENKETQLISGSDIVI
jgi:DNA recombination protein RmuC